MAGELTIEVTADGRATIRFPGGGQQTVGQAGDSAADNIAALRSAYGDRIGSVITTDKTQDQINQEQKDERLKVMDQAVNFTEQGSGYYGDAGGAAGYSEDDIQRYIDSDANKLGPGYSSVQEYVDSTLATSDRIASQYFDPNEWNNFTDKQKLAAQELYYQGNSDTGRTNGLSVKDIDFVKNKANDFKGIVVSPNTQAISTGSDSVTSPITTNTSSVPGGGVSLQDTPFVDRTVDRPEIVQTTPSTEVLQLKPGEVAPIDPSTPKTVVQQVAPVTQAQTPQAAPFVMPGSVPQTGTVATPVQSAGLSAVPGQVTYKTSYAGTAGAVPQTILTSTPGSGEQIASGYQQVPYINSQTNQTIIVTEFNGKPITYIPPGFVRQTPMAEQQQQYL